VTEPDAPPTEASGPETPAAGPEPGESWGPTAVGAAADGASAARCPGCDAPAPGDGEECPACGAALSQRVLAERPEDSPLPPFKARAVGVLAAPLRTFGRHHAGWGWALPWLVVALAGVVYGALHLGLVDVGALAEQEFERALEEMPASQREALGDALETSRRWGVFQAKVGLIGGPPLSTLLGVLFAGGLVFAISVVLGDGKADLMRSISVAAYASLVNVVGYGALAVGVLLGNPAPQTSLKHLVDPLQAPATAALLSRLDPIVLYYYVVLAAGLTASCGLRRRRAVAVAAGLYGLASLALIGMGALQAVSQGMGGGW